MTKFKVGDFIKLNEEGIEAGYNRVLDQDCIYEVLKVRGNWPMVEYTDMEGRKIKFDFPPAYFDKVEFIEDEGVNLPDYLFEREDDV